jgi:hypothetical protein
MVTVPVGVTVHTDGVSEVYVTGAPTEDVAARLNVPVPMVLSAGVAKVMN